MADLHKDRLEEQFGDAALEFLMSEYAEAEGMQLLSRFETSHQTMPDTLDGICQTKIRKVNQESEKEILLRRTVYRAAKIAAVFAIFLLLSVNLILSVEAIRVPFLNLCIDTKRYFSSLTFSQENTAPTEADPEEVSLPIDVPPGYSLSYKDHNHEDFSLIYEDSILFLGYQDADGHTFLFQTLPAMGSFSIDTEDAESTRFLLNGMQAIQIRQESDNMMRTIWVDPERQRLFDVSCNGMRAEEFEQHILHMSAMFMAPELYAD